MSSRVDAINNHKSIVRFRLFVFILQDLHLMLKYTLDRGNYFDINSNFLSLGEHS